MQIHVNYEYREAEMRGLLDIPKLAKFVLERENAPETTEVSISFVDDATIHELNREWRGIDRPTDVLSFECDGFDDDMPKLPEQSFELGDIVVAPDVAQAQAPQYGLAFADELSLLITHGLLHLCGYDHMQDAEARQMEAREQELLSAYWGRDFKRTEADGQ